LKKLTRELKDGIDTEPKALYLLAEIRKCIDGYDQANKNKYPNLYFYCNAEKLLNRFESAFSGTKDLKRN